MLDNVSAAGADASRAIISQYLLNAIDKYDLWGRVSSHTVPLIIPDSWRQRSIFSFRPKDSGLSSQAEIGWNPIPDLYMWRPLNQRFVIDQIRQKGSEVLAW